jgi:RND family efflux transporter MFP subunit
MFARLKPLVLPLGVLAAGFGLFAFLHATKPTPDEVTEPPRATAVHVAAVQVGDTQLMVNTQGDVRPEIAVDLVAQVGGRITSVSSEFIEGGQITPNEPLLSIDPADYLAAFTEAKARLAGAKVLVEQAKADADVARKQLAGVANPSALALRIPQVLEAESQLLSAEAALQLAETNLARTHLSLPFEGRVRETLVDLGQFVTPGTTVARVFGTERVEIRLPLTDSQLGALGIPVGYSASGENRGLPVDLYARSGGQERQWRGHLARVDAAINPETRSIFATVLVEAPYAITTASDMSSYDDSGNDDSGDDASRHDAPLAVGTFVDATIYGRELVDALQIPIDALRAGDRVFVIEEGVLGIRNVDVLHRDEGRAIVAKGLAPGELVVLSAIRNPIEGMRLDIIDGDTQALLNINQ